MSLTLEKWWRVHVKNLPRALGKQLSLHGGQTAMGIYDNEALQGWQVAEIRRGQVGLHVKS